MRYKTGDYSQPGGCYFVTICVIAEIDLTDDNIAEVILETMNFIDKNGHAKLRCYVIIPDHIHAIIQIITEKKSLSDIVWSFKRAITRKLKYPGGTLWQRSYYDRIIRGYDEYNKIVGYIAENPIRKGLIEEEQHYPLMKLDIS